MKRYTMSLAMIAVLLVTALAHGQRSGAAAAEIRQLHILAMENYDLADYASARDQLLSAIAKAREGKLEKELLNARSHLMLGAIYIIGGGDQAKALEHFKIALEIAPAMQPEPPLDTEAVKAALARADAELNPVITCQTLRGIDHQQVAQADEGQSVKIVFRAGPELRKGTAHLSYRTQEARDFVELDMSPQGDCEYTGEIPAEAVSGTTVHYFVSMKKDDGRYIAMRGNHKSPYPINVVEAVELLPDPAKETKDEVPDELGLGGKPKPRGAGCAGCGVAGNGPGSRGLALLALACTAWLTRRRRA
jgi:hypothetical protein